MHMQPTMLRRSLAYSAACAALQAKGRKEAAGPLLALTLATGQGTFAKFQRPGPGGPQPVQSLSVFVALCKQPGGQGKVIWQPIDSPFFLNQCLTLLFRSMNGGMP